MSKELTVNLKAEDCRLKIIYQGYYDAAEEGLISEEERDEGTLLGFGKMTIPKHHRKPMLKYYGVEEFGSDFNIDNEDWEQGYDYECNNSDFMIFYYHFLINTRKTATIKVEGEHIFWFIHDVFHAINDVVGTSMDCGPYQELERFKQAAEVLKAKGITMKESYVQKIVNAFNSRKWGCYYAWNRTRDFISPRTFIDASVIENDLEEEEFFEEEEY